MIPPAPQTQTSVGPALDYRGLIRKHKLRFGAAESLAAMTAEYAFFTPAVLYLHGGFSDGLLVDHTRLRGRDVPLYYCKFAWPIFAGLEARDGDADWNRVLWAVPREEWGPLLDFLCGATVVNRKLGAVVRYGEQVIEVIDPLALQRAALYRPGLPTLPVSALGVYGNRGTLAFEVRHASPPPPPRLAACMPDELSRVFAGAYLAGRNPFYAIEKKR